MSYSSNTQVVITLILCLSRIKKDQIRKYQGAVTWRLKFGNFGRTNSYAISLLGSVANSGDQDLRSNHVTIVFQLIS